MTPEDAHGSPIEVGKCKMCDRAAVGHSLWCSDECSEAYFDQDPADDWTDEYGDGTDDRPTDPNLSLEKP